MNRLASRLVLVSLLASIPVTGCVPTGSGPSIGATAPSGAAQRFAGTWKGAIQWTVAVGVTPLELSIDDDLQIVRHGITGELAVPRSTGGSLSWDGWGPTRTQQWRLTPESGGDRATVVVTDVLNSAQGTLKRTSRPSPPPSPAKPAPAPRSPSKPSQSWR